MRTEPTFYAGKDHVNPRAGFTADFVAYSRLAIEGMEDVDWVFHSEDAVDSVLLQDLAD